MYFSRNGLLGGLPAGAVAAMFSVVSLGQSQEVRGTWLTTTGPDTVRSGYATQNTIEQLKAIGVNTVYVESWKNGYTNYDSRVMQDLVGVDRSTFLNTPFPRDLLDQSGAIAHRNGMVHVAWFEYGFSSQFKGSNPASIADNPLTAHARSRGWLLEDQAGQISNSSNGFAWMNPAVPEVRQLLIDLTLEAVRTHDLDGVQFDDRLAWPKEFGWDATTAAIYQAETGRSLPGSVNDSRFREWRQGKVTQFARELSEAIRTERPDLHLSVSPSITGFSDTQYNAVWTDWLAEGLFDEYIPQVYRDNLSSYRATLPGNVQPFTDLGLEEQLVVGIRFNGSGADTPTPTVQQMIVDAALAGDPDDGDSVAGHSLFYSKGLLENAGSMASFYANQRDNPFFGPDFRPAPIIAELDPTDEDVWRVQVSDREQYRVIGKLSGSGQWIEIQSGIFLSGLHELELAGFDEVELLLDLRPLPGDATFDREVDELDLAVLLGHWGQQTAAYSRLEGELTGDGRIDAMDLRLLLSNWTGTSPPPIVVPEPASAVAFLSLALMGRRRSRRPVYLATRGQ